MVPKLVREGFRERVGLVGIPDLGGQKHFRRSESVGKKITAKTAANFLEIEVRQEK